MKAETHQAPERNSFHNGVTRFDIEPADATFLQQHSHSNIQELLNLK